MTSNDKNIYARLGVKTLINAQGTYTTLGGSLMPPEVLRAMADAARRSSRSPSCKKKSALASPS